ncbi:MAG: hypothetical protein IPN84_14590 [Sphingomonadales bacterium]|nr:hypothetical protein [Sphingomonadales bacterium]
MTKAEPTIGKAARATFLAHLAETSNVSASARMAKITSSRVYRERLRFPAFRAQWQDALAEGYARLEAELLAEALRPASGNLKDITLKSRQMKVRLGMTLLSLHRASVRGAKPTLPAPPARSRAEIRADWEAELDAMKDRMTADDSAAK